MKKKKPRIRPLALCVFYRAGKIFVAEGYDPVADKTFFRPIGGGIEFGEYAREAVAREIMEEIEAEIADLHYLGTLENIFEYNGKRGHEVVLMFDGRFVDEGFNDDTIVVRGSDDNQTLYDAVWKPLATFYGDDAPPLYPDGLLELLDKSGFSL